MFDVRVQGAEELRAVARALRRADRTDLTRELTRAIRDGAKPVLSDVQRAVRELPIRGFPYPGRRRAFSAARWSPSHALRDRVAQGVTVRVGVSEDNPRVRFAASGRLVPGTHGDSMPRRLDAAGGWRHQVLGNRQVWVRQQGKPWFGTTIYRRADEFRDHIDRALDRVREQIEAAR